MSAHRRRLRDTFARGAGLALLLSLGILAGPAPAAPRQRDETVARVQKLIFEWRIDEAAAALRPLVEARGKDADVELLRGELQFLQGDYDGAAARMRAAIGSVRLQPQDERELRGIADLAAATADATRGFVEQRSPGGHFVLRYRRGRDEVLIPYAGEALDKAWAALGADFGDETSGDGAQPKSPVRVEIYDEVADLAKVSTLTLKEIETSGTIALCKWNRLMIVSPKALLRGYPWIDTLTHEYTHYIVSRVGRGMVPIWLHEGLAKFEERRWRSPVPGPGTVAPTAQAPAPGVAAVAGSGLSPSLEHLLAVALQKKRFITFEQMSPSMAKLPSQEDTALAFAEVYTAIEFLHGRVGFPGLRRVLHELAQGQTDQRAIASVYGAPFPEFERAWKSWLRGRKLHARQGLYTAQLRFKKAPPGGKKPSDPAADEDSGEITDPRARNFVRLGGMLRGRGRGVAAALEYEKAQALVGVTHPLVALKLARTWLDLGEPDRAIAALEPARELYADLAGLAAALGAAYLKKGDLVKAGQNLEAAVATSPFDPAVHCGLQQIYQRQKSPLLERATAACALLSR